MSRLNCVMAYGRDAKSKAEVLELWNAGKDFRIADISSPDDGRYINKEDAEGSVTSVTIRYDRNTKVCVLTLRAGGSWKAA
jgi:hypothetical protein